MKEGNNMSNTEHTHSHVKLLAVVFTALICLTGITVAASYIDFGSPLVNIIVALGIASIKGSLVLVFFMHLKWEDKLTKVFAFMAVPFVLLFLAGDIADMMIKISEKLFLN